MFRDANQAGYVIYRRGSVYTLVSPDLQDTMSFLGRVVTSTGIWRRMITDLRDWLERTRTDEAKGQG